MKAKRTASHPDKTKKIILTSITVGAAGILGYFGWQYLKRRKEGSDSPLPGLLKATTPGTAANIQFEEPSVLRAEAVPPVPKKPPTVAKRRSSSTDSAVFPLKKGSTGEQVRQLQEALISRYGTSILRRHGADGNFGIETVNALKKMGLPITVEERMFNVLTQGTQPSGSGIGTALYNATVAHDFSKAMALLKTMKTKQDYTSANETFKTYRAWGVRQTIVNALLTTFTESRQQEQIKFEFLRIGLQFDGNQWSLSGVGGPAVMTAIPTIVWVNKKQCVQVPSGMVLGNQISERSGYTLFENRGRHFLVPTGAIQYLFIH